MIRLAPFTDRINFAPWLNEQGLTGLAVEIGTHRGEFAKQFLRMWQGEKLFCIDPYLSGYDPNDPASLGDRGEDMKDAMRKLRCFGVNTPNGRAVLLETTGHKAASSSLFESASLDFVYVDGCHQYASVLEDLMDWWSFLRSGGVLAGHDILSCDWEDEVQPAVFSFADIVQRDVFLVPAPGTDPWSYYMVK